METGVLKEVNKFKENMKHIIPRSVEEVEEWKQFKDTIVKQATW